MLSPDSSKKTSWELGLMFLPTLLSTEKVAACQGESEQALPCPISIFKSETPLHELKAHLSVEPQPASCGHDTVVITIDIMTD